MSQEFENGDRVRWRSHGGEGLGTVQRRITEETEAGGRMVKASKEEPQYLVRSEKFGRFAVHKPDALRKA